MQTILKRSCWLNPMHKDRCYFMSADLPRVSANKMDERTLTTTTTTTSLSSTDDKASPNKKRSHVYNLCLSGAPFRQHNQLAQALATLARRATAASDPNNKATQYSLANVKVSVFNRRDAKGLPRAYEQWNVSHLISRTKRAAIFGLSTKHVAMQCRAAIPRPYTKQRLFSPRQKEAIWFYSPSHCLPHSDAFAY